MLNIMPLRKPLCWNRTENSEGLRADQRLNAPMAVITDDDSPGVFNRMAVVDPPNMEP